jgi:hypothetical protein
VPLRPGGSPAVDSTKVHVHFYRFIVDKANA